MFMLKLFEKCDFPYRSGGDALILELGGALFDGDALLSANFKALVDDPICTLT